MITAAAVSLTAVATAWACANLATVTVGNAKPALGSAVTFGGRGYSAATNFSQVTLRLNTRGGRTLATGITPNSAGLISGSFNVPTDIAPGWYAVLGTQFNTTTGAPKSGTPGRTSIRVTAPGGAASASPGGGVGGAAWGSSSKPTGGSGASLALNAGGSSSAAFLPTLLGVMLSLGLLGGGVALVARSRTASRSRIGA